MSAPVDRFSSALGGSMKGRASEKLGSNISGGQWRPVKRQYRFDDGPL